MMKCLCPTRYTKSVLVLCKMPMLFLRKMLSIPPYVGPIHYTKSVLFMLRIRLHTSVQWHPALQRLVEKCFPPLPRLYCGDLPRKKRIGEVVVCSRSDAYVAIRHPVEEDGYGNTLECRHFFSAYHDPERAGAITRSRLMSYLPFDDYFRTSGIIRQTILYDYETPLRRNYPFDASAPVIYIFHAYLPEFIRKMARRNDNLRRRIYVLNTEQLSVDYYRTRLLAVQRQNVGILDYSPANIKCFPHPSIYLPYRRGRLETKRLKRFSAGRAEYDVAVIGAKYARRTHIVNQLKQRGITVAYLTDSWGEQRDTAAGKARILLNIHGYPGWTIYEHIRCDRWIFAGKLIVSEQCSNQESLDVADNVVFAPYDELVRKVEEALAGFDDFRREFTNNNLEPIAMARDAHWQRFAEACARDLAT